MFTGLVQDIGAIVEVKSTDTDRHFRIKTGLNLSGTAIGASICCSGCCLTAVDKSEDCFDVVVSNESLSKTHLGQWDAGTKINLEPSLRLGDELGGHFVFGHVDGQAVLKAKSQDGESWRLVFECPSALKSYIAPKGSVALDGVSLTVNEVEGAQFGVNIIPHTWDQTTLQYLNVGDAANIEVDMLARYVARMLDKE